jgi:flagellar biosynthetic protein FlhB
MAEQQDQSRNEAPTPFKLQKAREKGMVARSAELGFLGGLIALAGFGAIAGPAMVQAIAQAMRTAFSAGIDRASEPEQAAAMLGDMAWTALAPLILFGGTIVAVVVFLEILQLRGLLLTAQPLKPDFTRLNPATGLKRLFSMRMLKETLKTLLKSAVYGGAAWLTVKDAIARFGSVAGDGERLAELLVSAGSRLLLVFAAIAFGFVILDQILVRGEFTKQMRMSRREVTRETKDREGDPRIKAKRKQLHAEFVKQSNGLGALPGSDLVIVNPEHFAVALRYNADLMVAPEIAAKGRNRFALALRDEAYRLGIPVIVRPPLARALYRAGQPGNGISTDHYEAVAELYIELRRGLTSMEPA